MPAIPTNLKGLCCSRSETKRWRETTCSSYTCTTSRQRGCSMPHPISKHVAPVHNVTAAGSIVCFGDKSPALRTFFALSCITIHLSSSAFSICESAKLEMVASNFDRPSFAILRRLRPGLCHEPYSWGPGILCHRRYWIK